MPPSDDTPPRRDEPNGPPHGAGVLRRLQNFGVRARMSALILFAVAPLSVILLWSVIADRTTALDHARREVEQFARVAAEQQARSFDESATLLQALRLSPDIGFDGRPTCAVLMARAVAAQPQFRTIGVVDPDGWITCHNLVRDRITFGQPALLHAIQAPHAPEFQIGRFMIGKITGKPTIVSALRLPHPDGRSGILFASLDLGGLSQIAESSGGGYRSVLAIEPSGGTVMSQSAVRASLVGKSFPEHPLMVAARAKPDGGVVDATNFNGRAEIIGFAPLPRTRGSGPMVAVGVSRELVLAAANQRAMLGLFIGLATTLLALGTTWWLGYWSQVRPIRRLASTAQAIGGGAFSARAEIGSWQAPELRFLGVALDDMADRLAASDAAHRQSEAVLAASEARFRLLAENTADLITRVDARGLREFASPACRDLFGYAPGELLGGRPTDLSHPDDADALGAMVALLVSGRPAAPVQYRARRRDGRYVWVETSGRPLGADQGAILSMRDISRRKLAEDRLAAANVQLARLARQDGLTGLANRRAFDEAFAQELARAAREDRTVGLIIADVDKFKIYNDTYGHPAGDEVLKRVGATLASIAQRPGDLAARYGGEEFAAVLADTGGGGARQVAEAFRAAVEAATLPHAGSTTGYVTVSVGVVAVRPAHGSLQPVDVLRQADEALYAAKAAGRNRVIGYGMANLKVAF